MSAALKLLARSGAEIDVLSAHVQDAVLQVGDVRWLADERRFIAIVNRYRWEQPAPAQRVRSALNFAHVQKVQQRKINRQRRDGVLALLALQFDETDAPAGTVSLIFAGGAEIRLDVEAPEAILEDISAPWLARARPQHNLDEDI